MKKSLEINNSKEWGVFKVKPQNAILINKFEVENDEVATQFLRYYCNKICVFSVSSERDFFTLRKNLLKFITNKENTIPSKNEIMLINICVNKLLNEVRKYNGV